MENIQDEMRKKSANLKGSKERTEHLPKREVTWADWGGNILAGWEDGVGRGKELGEMVVAEKAGE